MRSAACAVRTNMPLQAYASQHSNADAVHPTEGTITWVHCAVQVLKITLDYWNLLVPDIFSSAAVIDANAAFAFSGPVPVANRRLLYAGILGKLRQLCITRMAKPEEARPSASLSAHGAFCEPKMPRVRFRTGLSILTAPSWHW